MFVYLSKKLEMPQGANVSCVAWSGEDNFLACGCDNGMLKVLKIEGSQPSEKDTSKSSLNQSINKGPLDAPSNVALNRTLDGHGSNDIKMIAWNKTHPKLTTSDDKGLIIVWMQHKGTWYEEMVNNRNKSSVTGIAWSQDGSKLCMAYEDGAVIVGGADGNRLWGKDAVDEEASLFATITGVTWSPDAKTLLLSLQSGKILIYDSEGNYTSTMKLQMWPKYSSGEGPDPIVTVHWRHADHDAGDIPSIIVIWRSSKMTLLRNTADENPTVIDTRLIASCGDWSQNGFFVAVGGTPSKTTNPSQKNHKEVGQVNIYDRRGKFLQIVKAPHLGDSLASLSWDYLSLRLAIGAGSVVYLANLRPLYKFAFFGPNVVAYTFVRSDDTNLIAFWDAKKYTIQEIPGKILDVKAEDDYFAVLSQSSAGNYNVSILNSIGAPVDSLNITSMDPFTISLTETILICLAPTALLLWRFQSATAHSVIPSDILSRRRERAFHIDETPNLIPFSNSQTDLRHKTLDPATCCDAKPHLLAVARDSGKIQLYSLPHGIILNVLDAAMEMGLRAQRIFLNSEGLQLAILDFEGCLSICSLSTSSMKSSTFQTFEKKDVWNLVWARDNPNLLCIMEKTKMFLIQNGDIEELEMSTGYLAQFKDLEIVVVQMDEIMHDPENPRPEHLIRIETPALRGIRDLIEQEVPLQEVSKYVENNSHPCLWRILAQAALNGLDIEIAEAAFVRCEDYAGIQLTKRISDISNELLRKAEVCTFFEDFDQAEKLYLESDRRDLAIEMWKLVGEWNRAEALTSQRPDHETMDGICLALGDTFLEEQKWSKALPHYEKISCDDPQRASRLFTCYLIEEDFEGLSKLASTLPPKSPLLPQIATAFAEFGLTTEAVKSYLACGMTEKAVETAVALSQWNLAMELAGKHSLHNVVPVLVRYTGHLLQSGEIMQAVELLKKSDKPYAAGKLLAMLALRELNNDENPKLVTVKQLFIMSALMFTYKTKKFFRGGAGKKVVNDLDDKNADLSFENHIPKEFRPTAEEFRWMRETPWRGAAAVHFLILTQRFIYESEFGNATKAALNLKPFVDILGEERVDSLLALASANNKSYNICSRAFINLEILDQEYSDIACDLFKKGIPKDAPSEKSECSACGTIVTEYLSQCPGCDSWFPVCVASGRPIVESTSDSSLVWTCETCQHFAYWNEVKNHKFCPLCHNSEVCRD